MSEQQFDTVNRTKIYGQDDAAANKRDTSIKRIMLDWAQNSSSHGLPRIIKSESIFLKVFWTVSFFAGIGGCGYFFIMTLINFFQYQVVAQITVTQERPAPFPAVTICNLNVFNMKAATNYVNTLLISLNKTYIYMENSTQVIQLKAKNNDTSEILDDIRASLIRQFYRDLLQDFNTYKLFTYDLEKDMLISCTFNHLNCDSSNFSSFISSDYGICYTYNYANERALVQNTSKVGPNNGLQLELFIGNPAEEVKYAYKSGLYLVIHNQSKLRWTIDDTEGINIAAGYDTYVGISRQFGYKLDHPYSNCLKNLKPFSDYSKKLYSYMTEQGFTYYDQEYCYKMCYQDQVISKCHCADPSYHTLGGADYCTAPDSSDCIISISGLFSTTNVDDLCQSACPVNCDSNDYLLTTSVATYPTTYYTNLLKTKTDFLDNLAINDSNNLQYLKESLLRVTINYNDLTYTTIREVPSTTSDALVGTIGGLLGLFLGLSLLSTLEIFELLFEITRYFYKKFALNKISSN